MNDLLPFIVSGIATGSIYGLAATGLVLTYKTSGIFNFGYGALATAAAYVFYWLYVDHGIDWRIAAFLSVFVLGPLMGLVMELIARQLAPQRTAWKIVGTVGLILIVQGLGTIKYGTDPLSVPQYLPKGTETFRVLDVNIGYDQLIITIISVIAVAALYALFRFTRLGIAMRAVVDDPELLDIQGTSPSRVRRISWIIGSTFAALSGVLIVPLIGLEPIALTFLVVQAFGAAAIGFFASIPLAYLGGILIGVVSDVSKKYVLDVDWLGGLPASLPFLILFAVLLVTPRHRLVRPSSTEARPALQWHGPPALRYSVGAAVVVALALVPQFVDVKLSFWTNALTQIILFLALGLLVRTAGLVSLCTTAFAAIGAVAFSQFAVDHNMPWLVALFLAALVAVPVGALVAIPAIRLSGLFLALATLGFGIMVERLFYPRNFMFTTFAEGRRIPRPSWGSSDEGYYYVVLAFVVVSAVVFALIHRGRLGRILRGLGDSPVAVSTLGLSTNMTRVIVFCIAAFFSAVAGILYGGLVNFATASDRYYQSFTSLILLAILALAPFREPWYAVFAGLTAVIPGYLTGADTNYWLNVIFGLFAILVALQGGPAGMPVRLQRIFERLGRRRAAVVPTAPAGLVPTLPRTVAGSTSGLEVERLTVRFGGLLAVDNLSFDAPMGRITGLIGPNGAGKTTTFNACSGLNRPSSGRILLHGQDVSSLSPAARARLGLGRSFQVMQLCESLTVFDNVALGRESSQAGARPISQLVASRDDQRVRAAAAAEALELCGITDLADRQAGELSTGQRRLVELARCLAGPFDLLLLDEPSSGLDRDETAQFGDVLQRVVDERGCGILLVEHDMSLVMRVCSYMYVLDFGVLIFDGDATAVAPARRPARSCARSSPATSHCPSSNRHEEPALQLRDITGGYGHTTVLRGVNLTVPAASVTALLGPNGAGKTTLLKIVSGLLRPTSGSVLIDGADVTKLSPSRRTARGVCHIPEGRGIFRGLTVRDNLIMQSAPGTEATALERATEVFPILGNRLQQTAGTLSGGEQQMLAMARAYVRQPRLILVDEASLGLAPLIVSAIFEFLQQLATQGVALLVVDQFVTRALAMADTAYILGRGEITWSGTAQELMGRDVFKEYLGNPVGAP